MGASAERGRIVVVCGPTATGKTELAIALARRYGGEMVSADSMQVYRGLVVGTAAPTAEELGGIPCHLTGFVPPEERYSVAEWLKAATGAIRDILARGRLPVVCGGTGLYIQSLVQGLSYDEAPQPLELRKSLEQQWDEQGGEAVYQRLAGLDPEHAARLHLNDKKRIIRALEQSLTGGGTAAARAAQSRRHPPSFEALCLGLNHPERAELYARINRRVDKMMERGLLAEAELVWRHRDSYQTAAQAIGYKEFFPYFEEQALLEGCVDKLKQATRNYAKRQLTWFRRMDMVHWLDAGAEGLTDAAAELVNPFVHET
ncbi:tRNA (adenosine(37)-N6)-dimethylallyltransferase MiaA [Ruminococcaceae bacterium OttesenSCG-928-D13]|nr:tRNA (adenosine(37)-N6)-dimethylallyltransferase MiaA [Ruminococcaceae bacterium OttesenSCG-928-D13]